MANITGGSNSLTLYKVTQNSSTGVVFNTTGAHTFDQTVSTTITKTESGFTIALDQIKSDSAVLSTFLEEAISTTAAVGEEITYEDGVLLSASSNNQTYLAVCVGGKVSGGTDKLVFCGLVTADAAATGSVTFSANTYIRPSIQFTTIAAACAVTLTTGVFPSTVLNVTSATTIPYTRKTGKYFYLPSA